jgi:methyl-accepting chemotaxis protein
MSLRNLAMPSVETNHGRDEEDDQEPGSAHTLQRGVMLATAVVAVLVAVGIAWAGYRTASSYLSSSANTRLHDVASRGALVLDRALLERAREIELIGADPTVIEAALEGARRSVAMGIVGKPIEELEKRFTETRSLDVSPRARDFLRNRLAPLGVAEIMVTDKNGFNVTTTARTSDFVQSDEAWWTRAVRDGLTHAEAVYDSSSQQIVVSIAAAVRERTTDPALGAIKIGFGIKSLDDALERATSEGERIDVVDSQGRLVASSAPGARMRAVQGAELLPESSGDSVVRLAIADTLRRAAVLAGNEGSWRIVAQMDESLVMLPLERSRPFVLAGLGGLLTFILVATWMASRFVHRRVTAPVTELALVAEAVAEGDLSVSYAPSAIDDEVGRLSRATATMIEDLRRLVGALHHSARETSARAAEITGGSESMAGAAQQMALTSSELSRQSTEMADGIQRMAGDAVRLRTIADELAAGSRDGVERNAHLSTLARENRARFDVSSDALEALADETRASAGAVAALADASEEFRAFVTLVQKMAKQSKLLALNAAMEAARAGEHGQGFAVVASEVRRLAANSAEAAAKTESLVGDVLKKVQASRASSAKTVETVEAVLDTTRLGKQSFEQVEEAVRQSEGWTGAIDQASQTSLALVQEMNARLDELAKATDSYAAAMQEVAASSEEQSASTEEIAAAASALSAEAARLTTLVAAFRIDRNDAPTGRVVPSATAEFIAQARQKLPRLAQA